MFLTFSCVFAPPRSAEWTFATPTCEIYVFIRNREDWEICNFEELSLSGILGQIRTKHKKQILEKTTKILSPKMRVNYEKLERNVLHPVTDAFRYDSAEKHCRLGSWRWRITKNAGFTAVQQEQGDHESSREPTASGKPEAVIIQKRGASAQRTQADHSRRGSLMSSSSQEPRTCEKRDAMFSSRRDEPGNQFESSLFNSLFHPIWDDLFLKAIKIICSVR